MSCKENQTFTFFYSLLKQWPGTMVWLSCVNTWTVCWGAKPPGFLLKKQGKFFELTYAWFPFPYGSVHRIEWCIQKCKILAFLYKYISTCSPINTNKQSDLYESLSAGTGIYNWNLTLGKIKMHSRGCLNSLKYTILLWQFQRIHSFSPLSMGGNS